MRSHCLLLTLLLASVPAAAQLNRAFVSTTGYDSSACTLADPCRSLGAAIAMSNPGGEVIVLDSGGYGFFVADRSISVIAPPGVHAGIMPTSGDALLVIPGAGGKVTLQGLALAGRGTASRGIVFTSGEVLIVERCTIEDFGNGSGLFAGVSSPASLFVRDTVIRNAALGGLWLASPAAPLRAVLDRVQISGISAYGLLVAQNVTAIVRNSVSSANMYGFHAEAGGEMTLENCTAAGNSFIGVGAHDSGTLARISNCVITGNHASLSGAIHSWGNNKVAGNTLPPGPVTPVPMQ